MFEKLLPTDVLLVSRRAPFERAGERRPVGWESWSVSRRADFATGRACAAEALSGLGYSRAEVGRKPGGAPDWPFGTVGSITHCTGFYAAAAASNDAYRSIGIDAEPDKRLVPPVVDLLHSQAEKLRFEEGGLPNPALVAFCVKESIYKAWHPIAGTWLDFLDADVTLDCSGTFIAVISHPRATALGLARMSGQWALEGGVAFAATLVRPLR